MELPSVCGRLVHRLLAAAPDLAPAKTLQHLLVDTVGGGHVLVPDLVGNVLLVGTAANSDAT